MNKLVLLLVDGLRADTARDYLGYVQALNEAGRAHWSNLRCELPSLSRPLYATVLNGRTPLDHGILGNVQAGQRCGSTVFDDLAAAGLLLAFTAFQVPLAVVLLMAPVRLLDPALAEAAATLGARPATFWRRVGLPLLAPSLIETASLLFANAAAAYATPFALAGTASPVLAVRIAAAVSGDIFSQPELATALSLVMAVLLLAVIVGGRLWSARLRRSA